MTPTLRRAWSFCLAALALLAPLSPSAGAETRSWVPIGPNLATVLSAEHQPSNGAVMLAGTYFGGLYRSTDWGYNWKPQNVPFSSSSVFSLHWDVQLPNRVYAGMFRDGIWRSDDAGITWQKTSAGLTDGSVQAVAVDPSSSQSVLAATPSGLFRSSNEGASWSPVAALSGVNARAVVYDAARPGTVFVGTNGQGVFKSTNGGLTWSGVAGTSAQALVNALSIDAAGNLYAATDAGVFQLPQDGRAWVNLRFNLPPGKSVVSVRAHPTVPNVLFATTEVGTYALSNWAATPTWFLWNLEGTRFVTMDRQGLVAHAAAQIGSFKATVDFGSTWVRADYGIQTAFIGGMATSVQGGAWRMLAGTELGVGSFAHNQSWKTVLPLREGVFDVIFRGTTAYAGAEANGVFKSTDGGVNWSLASNGIVPTRISDLTFTAEARPTLLAATGGGAYRSSDNGRTWEPVRIAEISWVNTVAADPVRPPIVWLGASRGRVYRSLDGGRNFSFAGTGLPPDDHVVKLVHAPWTAVYALTSGGKLYSTNNDGAGWFPVTTPCSTSPAIALRVDPVRGWVLYLLTAAGGICKSESGGLSWTTINNGISPLSLASLWISPADGSRLWAGGVGRVYRTIDAGLTWQSVNTGLPAGPVTALAGNPFDAAHLFAVVYGFGLYESRDSGTTWTLRSAAEHAATALALAPDPTSSGRVLLGTRTQGVQASNDAGATWVASNTGMSLFVRSLASDATDPLTLYAGSLGGGIFRTRDGATTWTNVGLTGDYIFRVRSPSGSRVLVGTANGVAESLDSGATWAEAGQRTAHVSSMVVDPADARRVMTGGPRGEIRISDTTGVRWRRIGSNLPQFNVLALAACPDRTVIAATERSGVWKSSFANPDSWSDPGNVGLGQQQVTGLACDPRSGFFYAATNNGGVFLSTTAGASWTPVNAGLVGRVMSGVVPSSRQQWRVWAAVRDGTVYRSDNAGLNWVPVSAGLPGNGVARLVTGPDGVLYAGTDAGVFRLRESATTWEPASGGLPAGTPTALWADPSRNGAVFAALGSMGVYRSTNGGTTWTRSSTADASADVTAFAGAGASPTLRVYAATQGTGVAWSVDGGTSFGPVQLPGSIPQVVLDLAVDAADPNTIYLASGGQGIVMSRDGGAFWSLANNGLSSLETLCVASHPTRSGEVYAGTHAGVFVTRDRGASWTAINTGLVNKNVTALLFDSVLPETLFAGIEGGGIWYLDTRP